MHRFIRAAMVLTAVVGIGACKGSTASQEADVVIAPADLVRALAEDRQTALATYGGKVLELSGTISEKIGPSGLNPTIGVAFAGIDDQLAFDANLPFVTFDSEDRAARSEFEELAVGDEVTLRCRLEVLNESGSLFLVKGCRVAR